MIAKIPDNTSSFMKEYMKNLKSGYHLGADLNYFISEQYGIGLKYNYFNSKNHLDNVYFEYDDGSIETGMIEDKIAINFFGTSFTSRVLSADKKSAFITTVALGYLSYKNEAIIVNENLIISGSAFGTVFDLGYDFGISDEMALGLQLSFTLGTLTKLEFDYGGYTETIELETGNYQSLTRVDLSIGLRFNK